MPHLARTVVVSTNLLEFVAGTSSANESMARPLDLRIAPPIAPVVAETIVRARDRDPGQSTALVPVSFPRESGVRVGDSLAQDTDFGITDSTEAVAPVTEPIRPGVASGALATQFETQKGVLRAPNAGLIDFPSVPSLRELWDSPHPFDGVPNELVPRDLEYKNYQGDVDDWFSLELWDFDSDGDVIPKEEQDDQPESLDLEPNDEENEESSRHDLHDQGPDEASWDGTGESEHGGMIELTMADPGPTKHDDNVDPPAESPTRSGPADPQSAKSALADIVLELDAAAGSAQAFEVIDTQQERDVQQGADGRAEGLIDQSDPADATARSRTDTSAGLLVSYLALHQRRPRTGPFDDDRRSKFIVSRTR
jgi:hypothetical protein